MCWFEWVDNALQYVWDYVCKGLKKWIQSKNNCRLVPFNTRFNTFPKTHTFSSCFSSGDKEFHSLEPRTEKADSLNVVFLSGTYGTYCSGTMSCLRTSGAQWSKHLCINFNLQNFKMFSKKNCFCNTSQWCVLIDFFV